MQQADENVIAREQKQADGVEVTNLVSDEDDGVDMKDELVLRHEGMSKCEHVRGPHIGEPQRRQLGDDLVEYSKFDVSKQCKDCVDLHKTWASLAKQSSITVTVISQVLQWIGNMYHEFMQLIDGAKGAFPAARNTNLPCIPATRIETKPWSLFGEESEAQLLANFTDYWAERLAAATLDVLQPERRYRSGLL